MRSPVVLSTRRSLTRGPDLDRPGLGDHRPRPVVAVADHHASSGLVLLLSQLGYVLVYFRLQRGCQQAPGPLAHGLVDQGAGLDGSIVGDCAGTSVSSRPEPRTRAYSVTISGSSGKVRPPRSAPGLSHSLEHCSEPWNRPPSMMIAGSTGLASDARGPGCSRGRRVLRAMVGAGSRPRPWPVPGPPASAVAGHRWGCHQVSDTASAMSCLGQNVVLGVHGRPDGTAEGRVGPPRQGILATPT